MSVATAPDRHGLSIRRTPHGWALFRGSEHLYETNNRERVEWALQEELDRLKLGEVLRQVLASRECPTATLPAPAHALATKFPQATRPKPALLPPRPLIAQRNSAIHQAGGSSDTSSTFGQAVTFTATVCGTLPATPTGTVKFP